MKLALRKMQPQFLYRTRVPLTQFIKVCVNAIWSWDRAHQPGFVESAPLVD